jgi:uncharacterized protein (DUF1330 family)
MPAYVIAMMAIHDQEIYRKYTDLTPPTVKKYGGKFLTRGEPVTTLDGEEYKHRMVILEFPTMTQVKDWLNDPDYQRAAEYRKASSTMGRLMVQEGGGNTEDPDPKL